jgi:hypothetical protein
MELDGYAFVDSDWRDIATALLGAVSARSALQTPAVCSVDENVLREYAGVYRWEPNAFVHLQMWNEFTGFTKPSRLVAFDESVSFSNGDIQLAGTLTSPNSGAKHPATILVHGSGAENRRPQPGCHTHWSPPGDSPTAAR